MSEDLSSLQPAAVWRHFFNLCHIPRASGDEAAVREALSEWASKRGLCARSDGRGNLILSKPATPGYENRPGVVLQGHLDMVCQKHGGSTHDFRRDPIRPVLRDGWVSATGTTLGADNGVGVALALAVLEADDLEHPALEVLLTVEEESGMHGAMALERNAVQGRLLINLDTEEWGKLYIGCAGSADVIVDSFLATEAAPVGLQAVSLRLSGLLGGHSGIDIHRGRGNAIKLLARFLYELAEKGFAFRLMSMAGGTAHNAIAREAEAVLWVEDVSILLAQAEDFIVGLRSLLNGDESGVRFDLEFVSTQCAGDVLTTDAAHRILTLLYGLPYGVRHMSDQMPDVVETSNNIGELRLENGRLHINMMVRSLDEYGIRTLSDEIVSRFSASGLDGIRVEGAGPVWHPNPGSKLLALAQEVFRQTFDSEAAVLTIHAGLECGSFYWLWPDMDMISFGPTIRGAHAPNEQVETVSVERAWQLLAGILAAIPEREF
ncbi:MAG: aminoacyl-histidine dipeptidase [Betaproteobacteria bacterium]|nr:aminoacyl-histidine dipeptidase [Betaproteobacteria bacterium]